MKLVFLGATRFSEDLLIHLLNNGVAIDMLFTIPLEFPISYSDKKVKNYNYSDLASVAEKHKIPFHLVESVPGKRLTDYSDQIKDLNPDVILVMGWYYMVPKIIRDLATHGAWGIHASLLPEYAGGAPLVWAIIEGCKKTGVTLFRLEDGVDDGDIIAQAEVEIGPDETIREVYENVTEVSKSILLSAIKNIDTIKFTPQDKSKIKVYPQRKPEDGEINLAWAGEQMYNFIRAQAPPYPGAFIKTVDGKKIIIEKARIAD